MSLAGAPVTKACVLGVSIGSVLAATTTRQYLFNVPWSPHIARDRQFWRLLSHHVAFANSAELFVSVLLLFYTSVAIERMFGSVKFASFLVATTAVSTLIETIGLYLGSKFTNPTIPAGPFAIIFAIVYQSVMLVPSTFTWRLFGFDITNRVALYLLSAQLMSSQPPASVLSSLAGITASAMYSFNLFSLRSFRLPPRLVSIASRLMSPLILPINPPTRGSRASLFGVDPSRPSATQARQARAAAAARTQTGTQAAPPQAGLQPTAQAQAGIVPPAGLLQQWRQGITGSPGLPSRPTNEQIEELSAIFPDRPRQAIIEALQRNSMNVQLAANSLLTSS